jgi:hypothetical protein
MAGKDLLTRLADAGEDALARLVETPGAERVVGYANAMRDRVDELQKKVRGIDELERRVTELERRLEEASGGASGRSRAARPAGASARRGKTAAPSTSASGTTPRPAKKAPAKKAAASRRAGSSKKTGGSSPG